MLKMATHVGAHVKKVGGAAAPHKSFSAGVRGAVAALVHENAEAKEPIPEQHRPQDPHQRMIVAITTKGRPQPLGGH